MQFTKATQKQSRLRMALIGPSGSGKTYSALNIGQHLGARMALIDTERGSASKYASLFAFDVLELDSYSPLTYVQAIAAADQAGYDVLIIDSLSHAWSGKGGALEIVDQIAKRTQSANTFGAWREVTPMHNQMVDAILGSRCHVIATVRAKTEHVQEKDERGKTVIRKLGFQPVQRDGLEYEFDVVADMTIDNELIVSKSRCPALTGAIVPKPGAEVADALRAWLESGEAVALPTVTPAMRPTANGTRKGVTRGELEEAYQARYRKALELNNELESAGIGKIDLVAFDVANGASVETISERGLALREEIADKRALLVSAAQPDQAALI